MVSVIYYYPKTVTYDLRTDALQVVKFPKENANAFLRNQRVEEKRNAFSGYSRTTLHDLALYCDI